MEPVVLTWLKETNFWEKIKTVIFTIKIEKTHTTNFIQKVLSSLILFDIFCNKDKLI